MHSLSHELPDCITISQPRRIALAALLGLLVATTGCGGGGPSIAPVSGTVRLDGKPLAGASVVFEPQVGKVSRAFTDDQGRFELVYLRDIKGALVGRHTVRITTNSEADPSERLPACYHVQSDLTREVEPGGNTFHFDLSSQ
jgi:hypothetical protein